MSLTILRALSLHQYRFAVHRCSSSAARLRRSNRCCNTLTANFSSAAATNSRSHSSATRHLLILGSGIHGLSAALLLQQRGYSVTVLTTALSPNITSDIAGASIVPSANTEDVHEQRNLTQWTKQTNAHLSSLLQSHPPALIGAFECDAIEFPSTSTAGVTATAVATPTTAAAAIDRTTKTHHTLPWWSDAMLNGVSLLTNSEVASLPFCSPSRVQLQPQQHSSASLSPQPLTLGFRYRTHHIDTSRYLRFLRTEYERGGGELVVVKEAEAVRSLTQLRAVAAQYQRLTDTSTLRSAEEIERTDAASSSPLSTPLHRLLLHRRFDTIINCTGLSSRTLVPDPSLLSVKGVVFRLPTKRCEQLMKRAIIVDDCGFYLLPRSRHEWAAACDSRSNRDSRTLTAGEVTIGGVWGIGDESDTVDESDRSRIFDAAARCVPELKPLLLDPTYVSSIRTLVGFRPYRDTMRIELVMGKERAPSFPVTVTLPQADAERMRQQQCFYSLVTEEYVARLKTKYSRMREAMTPQDREYEAACESSGAVYQQRAADSQSLPALPVIHCYGSGGSGIAIHYGAASKVAALVDSLFR